LLARWVACVSTSPDEGGGLGRHFVRIHLVAEEQQGVGPVELAAL